MNGKILKKLNEYTPDIIKKLLSKQIRLKVINNKVFNNTLSQLKKIEDMTEEEKIKVHLDKLKDVLIYAYENTIYYKKVFDKVKFNPYTFSDVNEMKNIPIINKKIVMDHFNEIISKEEINHYIAYTGGSTGKPLKILLDTDSIYKEKAFVYNYWRKFGYDYKKSKIVTLRGLEFKGRLYKYNPIDNQIVLNPFTLNDDTVEKYVAKINSFKPEFIHGYASAIYNLCRLINKKNLKLNVNIEGICFVSENVDDIEKKYIEETLNCKGNIFYGHSERAVFAEYINDSYTFNDLYTHVELIETEENNVFSIACTGLLNKKMPLINYVPDDKVVLSNDKINIYGHWDKELLIGKNDEKVSMASINFHSEVFNKIKMYQFEQFTPGRVVLNIVEDETLTEKDKKNILHSIDSKLLNIIDVEINIVSKIELTNRGKYKKIIQHI